MFKAVHQIGTAAPRYPTPAVGKETQKNERAMDAAKSAAPTNVVQEENASSVPLTLVYPVYSRPWQDQVGTSTMGVTENPPAQTDAVNTKGAKRARDSGDELDPSASAGELESSEQPFKGDGAQFAKKALEGVGDYINSGKGLAEYKLIVSGLANMNEAPPGADTKNCVHLAFSQEMLGAPVEVIITIRHQAGTEPLVYKHVFTMPQKNLHRTSLNARILYAGAWLARQMREYPGVPERNFVDHLVTDKGRDMILSMRKNIFLKLGMNMSSSQVVTASLACKPILKSTGMPQVNEAKESEKYFAVLMEALAKKINKSAGKGKPKYVIWMRGMAREHPKPVLAGNEKLLEFEILPYTDPLYVTVRFHGLPPDKDGAPIREYEFHMRQGTQDGSVVTQLPYAAAFMAGKMLEGKELKPPKKIYESWKTFRKKLNRDLKFQENYIDVMQALHQFGPIPRAAGAQASVKKTVPAEKKVRKRVRTRSNLPRPTVSFSKVKSSSLKHVAGQSLLQPVRLSNSGQSQQASLPASNGLMSLLQAGVLSSASKEAPPVSARAISLHESLPPDVNYNSGFDVLRAVGEISAAAAQQQSACQLKGVI